MPTKVWKDDEGDLQPDIKTLSQTSNPSHLTYPTCMTNIRLNDIHCSFLEVWKEVGAGV